MAGADPYGMRYTASMSLPRFSLCLLCAACTGKAADTASMGGRCVASKIVAADIDETLTTSDGEWIQQLGDPTHIPAMRPDANTLMHGYADLGYRVVYITARGEELVLLDDRPTRAATWDWLTLHGFPGQPEDLFLADGIGVAGDAAVAYKAGVLGAIDPSGSAATWAYGNATTDIRAFLEHGIADEQIFLVGELAGTMGVTSLPDEAAYTTHTPDQLSSIAPADCLP